jgi:hypothetical protein
VTTERKDEIAALMRRMWPEIEKTVDVLAIKLESLRRQLEEASSNPRTNRKSSKRKRAAGACKPQPTNEPGEERQQQNEESSL